MGTVLQKGTVWTLSLASGFCFPVCEMEMAAKEVKGRDGGRSWCAEAHAHLSRNPGCALHLPGQATSGENRLFFRHIGIFGGFTSTKSSLNLLQWPREGSINQQLVKVEVCGGEETQNENPAWQW